MSLDAARRSACATSGGRMLYAGLDLGQKKDFSALAVVEREDGRGGFNCLRVRHLERVSLGTPYAAVVERVSSLLCQAQFGALKRLVVDATGVGVPVVELLQASALPCPVTAVTMTAGAVEHGRGEEWHVPKRDLLTGLLVLLEQRQLRIPRGLAEAGTLVRELTDIEVRQRARGRARMGAEGEGKHDDLAMALALACWRARKGEAFLGWGSKRLPGI